CVEGKAGPARNNRPPRFQPMGGPAHSHRKDEKYECRTFVSSNREKPAVTKDRAASRRVRQDPGHQRSPSTNFPPNIGRQAALAWGDTDDLHSGPFRLVRERCSSLLLSTTGFKNPF